MAYFLGTMLEECALVIGSVLEGHFALLQNKNARKSRELSVITDSS